MDDQFPATEPAGALVPPPRKPPTAVGTSAPFPPSPVPRRPSFPHTHPARRRPPLADAFRSAVNGALDLVDSLAERIERAARQL